jgi:methionyl-tRNA formyltransferase
MRIIFFGTPQFAVPTLERLLNDSQFQVLGVVTQPDKRRGRGNQLTPSPVKISALGYNLPVWQPEKIKKDRETIDLLSEANADVFIVVAYGQILSKEILEIPANCCINVHGSLLPKYRGAAPIQWSIYHGDQQTGITTMVMDKGMDTGAMLLKETTPITLLDNCATLSERLAEIGADLLLETLIKIKKEGIIPEPQNAEEATYAPLLKDENYQIDWGKSSLEIHNQIRGFYPNCLTTFRNQNLKLLATAPLGPAYWSQLPPDINKLQQNWDGIAGLTGRPGEIIHIAKGIGPIISTGKGLILLREAQLAGKRPMSGPDFVNGTRLTIGEILG